MAFFFAFPFVYTAGNYDYIMHICIVGFFYAILASSWSMLAGYAGQFSFGHMAFMGLGAYTAALFCHYFSSRQSLRVSAPSSPLAVITSLSRTQSG